jgi:hypothetical protein
MARRHVILLASPAQQLVARVVELFEARTPKRAPPMADRSGVVRLVVDGKTTR